MSTADRFREWKWRRRVRANIREIESRSISTRPHGLDAPLIVSLTSFPPRFPQLVYTLRCLLSQTVRPDEVVLWCSKADIGSLPGEACALQDQGLRIAGVPDLRSFKKLVPALLENPNRYIATADDDLHYRADWLEEMVKVAKQHRGKIISHRAHQITFSQDGAFRPYAEWNKNIAGEVEGPEIFATGVGGALYPPQSLHTDATDADMFMTLCPTADDIWFYWMARKAGIVVRHIGPGTRIVEWSGSQDHSLKSVNLGASADNGNDAAITALLEAYGWPLADRDGD